MNNAIQKAAEEGYKIDRFFYARNGFYFDHVLLDPLFWQALGKAMGWNRKCGMCGEYEGGHNYRHIFSPSEDIWKDFWHSFIDHLAEGKDADSFFKELLEQKK